MNDLVSNLLKGTDYTYFIKNDGTHIFIDQKSNTLRVSPKGLVEYEQKQDDSLDNQELNFRQALGAVVDMIEKIRGVGTLYINNFYKNQEEYHFEFSDAVSGIQIMQPDAQNLNQLAGSLKAIVNKDHIQLEWSAFKTKSPGGNYYLSSDHDSIINAIFNSEGSDQVNIKIEEIRIIYYNDGRENDGELPAWLVKYKVNGKDKWITVSSIK
jgi:hypothetical protein